jgi:hypothetical protein
VKRAPAILAIGWALGPAAPAFADHTSIHGTVVGSVATTDNVFAQPRDQAEPDLYMQVRPGMLFAYDSPRAIQELTLEVEFLEYVAHSSKPSVTLRGGWQGFFQPGPRSQVTTGVNASTGQLNAMSTRTSPDQSGINVLPPGQIDTRQADASEYGTYQAGKDTRVNESIFGRWTSTQDQDPMVGVTTDAYEAGGALGGEHTFNHDTVALDAGISYLWLQRLDPHGVQMGSRQDQQLNPRGSLSWRHDINREWSANANGGLVYVNPIGTDPFNPTAKRRADLFPTFGATVAYSENWGLATLTIRRAVAPNMYIAENTVNEGVAGTVALPLPWFDEVPHARNPRFVGLGTIGYERSQLIDSEQGGTLGTFNVVHVDLGVGWSPSPGQTYSVRYEFMYQNGDSTATMTVPSYWRNTLFFTFALRYPDRIAAQVPRRTESLRSDRKDLAPMGAEPVVPDPAEALPQGGDEGGDQGEGER